MKPREVTAATPIVVNVMGEKGTYRLADAPPGPISSWANTLGDLMGYTPEHVRDLLIRELRTQYGVMLHTAAGNLCPIRFMITLESRRYLS